MDKAQLLKTAAILERQFIDKPPAADSIVARSGGRLRAAKQSESYKFVPPDARSLKHVERVFEFLEQYEREGPPDADNFDGAREEAKQICDNAIAILEQIAGLYQSRYTLNINDGSLSSQADLEDHCMWRALDTIGMYRRVPEHLAAEGEALAQLATLSGEYRRVIDKARTARIPSEMEYEGEGASRSLISKLHLEEVMPLAKDFRQYIAANGLVHDFNRLIIGHGVGNQYVNHMLETQGMAAAGDASTDVFVNSNMEAFAPHGGSMEGAKTAFSQRLGAMRAHLAEFERAIDQSSVARLGDAEKSSRSVAGTGPITTPAPRERWVDGA